MNKLRTLLTLLVVVVLQVDARGQGAKSDGPMAKRALNVAFKGRIVRIEKRKVTIRYDFEDPAQLEDFEPARPPRLLDGGQNQVKIEGGRLVLEGSTSIRQKMEGTGRIHARFIVKLTRKYNVGAVITEPVLSDFYVVYNLFDFRFNRKGNMHIAACGLHEDEGAQDLRSGLVNFRDIFNGNLRKEVKLGRDIEVEVRKERWTEFFRVGRVKGKGSSKGKTKDMRFYKFGLFVHGSRATFDDLTLTVELTEEYLDNENLRAELDPNFPSGPDPLAGITGVPLDVRKRIHDYDASGKASRLVIEILDQAGLSRRVREVAARILAERNDPKVVPLAIGGLTSEDKISRRLSIQVVKSIVGKTFGYSPGASKKSRAAAIEKLKVYLNEHRERYYG